MNYKAVDERGKTCSGRLDAANAADLEVRLKRLGLDLITFGEAKLRAYHFLLERVRRRDLIAFCFHLEQLVASGVPVLDGLRDLRDSVDNHRLRETIGGMIELIDAGKTLSGAMEAYPKVFSPVFVNLVRAGEVSGQLAEVLRSLTENLKWQDEQLSQMKRLTIYPILVGTLVLFVLVFLMTYLVPQLVAFVSSMGQEMPLHTRVLLAVSDAVVGYWPLFLLVVLLVVVGVNVAIHASPSARFAWDSLKLRVWIVGPILKKMILARFANYFALMYSSGISVLDCIRLSEDFLANRAVEMATHRAGQRIAEGASISAGFEYSGLFPPLVLRMLRVGESTGALDAALLNISYFYNRDVSDSMERLQELIGPVLTVLLGAIMFWVIVSVLGPVYDLITQLQL